jgi:hypothetical protein
LNGGYIVLLQSLNATQLSKTLNSAVNVNEKYQIIDVIV